MPQLENRLMCTQFVIPKIVMSTNNLNNMNTKTSLEKNAEINNTGIDVTLELHQDQNCHFFSKSPEITCSPSPCVFDSNCKNSGKKI